MAALGFTEVPNASGGAYWCDDEDDGRDFHWGYETSDRMRENVFAEGLDRLKNAGWLNETRAALETTDLVKEALRHPERALMKGAQLTGTIDYVRAVHAEMAAITDAARHGLSLANCTPYSTTFPCHDCAKHIVSSAIKRVVYIEVQPVQPWKTDVEAEHNPQTKPIQVHGGRNSLRGFYNLVRTRLSAV